MASDLLHRPTIWTRFLSISTVSHSFEFRLGVVGLLLCFSDLCGMSLIDFSGFRQNQKLVGVVVVETTSAHLVPQPVAEIGAVEDASQAVVLGGWNRIKLMVVATSATDRQTKYGSSDRINLLVNVVHYIANFESLIDVLHTERQKTSGDKLLFPLFLGICGQ